MHIVEVDDDVTPHGHRGYRWLIKVLANGKTVDVADGATVEHLLTEMGLGGRWVLVERNGEPVPRDRLATTRLADGDRLELVRAAAGG